MSNIIERELASRIPVFRASARAREEKFTGWCWLQPLPGYREIRHYINGVMMAYHTPCMININTGQHGWSTDGSGMWSRIDGYALYFPCDPIGYKGYYIHGVEYTEQEFNNHSEVVQHKLQKILEVRQ